MINKITNLYPLRYNLFAANTNVTGDSGMTAEMKTYYSKYMIDVAEPEMVHDQFAQQQNIPANGGKTIEFRRYNPLPTLTAPITEGVTPSGQKLEVETVTATVQQFGGFVELSDVLKLTAIDNNLVWATELLGGQAGRTLDRITKEAINAGTNVQYAAGQVSSRGAVTAEMHMTVDAVRKAVRYLKVMNAKKINGYYAGIIHPDVSYDLMSDPKWVNVKTYSDPDGIYEGEIGKIEGVRFVETSEAKVWEGEGSGSADVYSTLIIGKDAYATTSVDGGGLKTIIKQLGSAGTADPLDQRATAGWKALKASKILMDPYMIRIETSSSFSGKTIGEFPESVIGA